MHKESELRSKLRAKSELKLKMASEQNHSVLLKREKSKLKASEVSQFRSEVQVDRHFSKQVVVTKHRQIDLQLTSKSLQSLISLAKRQSFQSY